MKRLLLILCCCSLEWISEGNARAQTITNQPQSITVNNASTAAFTVGATGATNYQWRFNNTPLTDATNLDGVMISGSATPALTLEDVTTNEAGTYTVVLQGSGTNSVTSSNAVLSVVPGTIVTFSFSGLMTNAPGSNVVVQLFNHDKPTTVENFLQYITTGAYSNMFFDRCITNFVLQGGDDGASDRTSTTAPISGWDIYTTFTTSANQPNPPFNRQINSEFNVGPVLKNDFGTITMALQANSLGQGLPNTASSAFFFNLADNSTGVNNLDTAGNGPFTVFGRVISGGDVLQYFNTLSNAAGIVSVTNGAFSFHGSVNTNQAFPDLPVNYPGTTMPANADLVFCAMSLTNPPGATNKPTVTITSPTPNAVLSNSLPLIIQGTAIDTNDIGLAWVRCDLTPMAAADGTLPNGGVGLTNYILGTTNWTVNFGLVPPGEYELGAQVQDEATNLSAEVSSQPVIVTTIVTNGNGTVTATNNGTNLDAVGYPFQIGANYLVTATPGTNQLFVNWRSSSYTIDTPALYFQMGSSFLWTATFISNGIPNSIAFTYPPSNGLVTSNTLNITGTISNAPSLPLIISCQIFETNGQAYSPVMTTTGSTNWSVTVSNLPINTYTVQAVAEDTNGNGTVIFENFKVTTNAFLHLNVIGPGTVSGPTNDQPIPVGTTFQVTAIPAPGQFFYTWSDGSAVGLNPDQTVYMDPSLTLTATFVSNTLPSDTIAFTSPASNVVLSNYSVRVAGTISNAPSPPVSVTCQIFSNGYAVSPVQTNSGTTNWSLIMSGLNAGSYVALVEAMDQASNSTVIQTAFTASVDTNAPGLSILSPSNNSLLTAIHPLIVSGSASDSNGLAWVLCNMAPLASEDGTSPNHGVSFGDFANGTTNWSLDFGIVPAGVYSNVVLVLDNVGNPTRLTRLLTNTAVLINGNGTVTLTQNGFLKPDPIGYPLQYGSAYQLSATPGAGARFVAWSAGAYVTTNRVVSFTNYGGQLWTATFAPSNSGKGISFTYPAANALLKTNSFRLKGRLAAGYESAPVSCRMFSLTTGSGVGPLSAESGLTTWSAGVSNLPADNYVVEAVATNSAGQTTLISERFGVTAFANTAGTYSGLFLCSNAPVAPTNSGFLTFTLTPTGAMTGRLMFPAYAPVPIYPLLFRNSYFISGSVGSGIANFHGKPLNVAIQVDLNGGSETAVGTISSDTWSSELVCYRAVTKLSPSTTPATGKYILSLEEGSQTNGFGTNGYAALVVGSGGTIAVSGALPDATTFSESARVSKDGIWPLYAVPAGDRNEGMLIGWETNSASGTNSGQLYWYKAPNIGAYFPGGIGVVSNMLLNSTGTNFVRPAPGSQYSIVFEGGTIAPPLTNGLVVNEAGQFVVSNSPPDKLKISLSASGVLAGSIVNPNDNQTLRFRGALMGPSEGGSGFIPEAGGQIGCFEVEPEPQ
jgi:cyclophilin family peptidyl-prolyl cis-trans isomerase